MADGLNIATKSGEGQANVLNWGEFHNTLNRLYERDIQEQTAIKNQYQKSEMQLLETAKGLRPPDIPKFKQLADDYKQASLMLMNPKVKKDPQQTSFWKSQQQDAYINAVSHAERSKDTQKQLHDLSTLYAQKNGRGMLHPEDWNKQWDATNNMTSDQISQMGLNVPTKWMRPMVSFPKKDFIDYTLGKEEKQTITRDNPNDPSKQDVYEVKSRGNKPHEIGLNVLKSFEAAPDTYDYHKQIFENLQEKGDIYTIQNTIDEANKLDPSFPKQYDAAHFAAADLMLQAKPKETLLKTINKQLTEEQKFQSYKRRAELAAGLRVEVANKLRSEGVSGSGADAYIDYATQSKFNNNTIPLVGGGQYYKAPYMKDFGSYFSKKATKLNSKNQPIQYNREPDEFVVDEDNNLRVIFYPTDKKGNVNSSGNYESDEIIPKSEALKLFSKSTTPKKMGIIQQGVDKLKTALTTQNKTQETKGKKQYKGLDKDGNPIFK